MVLGRLLAHRATSRSGYYDRGAAREQVHLRGKGSCPFNAAGGAPPQWETPPQRVPNKNKPGQSETRVEQTVLPRVARTLITSLPARLAMRFSTENEPLGA